jgi:putative DNA base modification enzyme with NMAD domain
MPTRINESIRHHVICRIVEDKFKPLQKALDERGKDVALAVYNAMYNEEQQKLMASLPSGWLCTRTRIEVSVDGERHCYYLAKDKPSPDNHRDYRTTRRTPVGALIHKYETEKEAFEERKDEALRLARAALASHRTVEALVKAWPEVEPYLPKGSEPMTTALAVPVKQLNALLGLP